MFDYLIIIIRPTNFQGVNPLPKICQEEKTGAISFLAPVAIFVSGPGAIYLFIYLFIFFATNAPDFHYFLSTALKDYTNCHTMQWKNAFTIIR